MKKLIIIAFVAVATYLYIHQQKPAVVQKPVAAAISTPAPVVARPIVVAPAPSGDLKDRWKTGSNAQTELKTGPNAQTDLTEGASWK